MNGMNGTKKDLEALNLTLKTSISSKSPTLKAFLKAVRRDRERLETLKERRELV